MIDEPNSQSAEPPSSTCQIVSPADKTAWNEAIEAIDERARFLCSDWTYLLQKTYGYERNLVILKIAQQIHGVLPYVIVKSPFTGTRAISLPFFDICRTYSTNERYVQNLYEAFKGEGQKRNWDYIELRGDIRKLKSTEPSLSFYNHIVDLQGGPDNVFARMAPSTRRAIRKSEKSDVRIERSNSLEALKGFYRLQCITRKRHGLPPQPFAFFENLLELFIKSDRGCIISAYVNDKLAASGVYLEQGNTAHYKYGASDSRFQQARCNNSVMWHAMKHYSEKGLAQMDLGRNSLDNEGLRKYKLSWGSVERTTHYHRYDLKKNTTMQMNDEVYGWHNKVFSNLPIPLTRLAGRLLYRHIA